MKKAFLLMAACSLFLVSCSNENIPVLSQENQKNEAVQNFKQALTHLNNPENLPTEEEKRSPEFPEMSERRLDILYPAAKGLIKSTGVKDDELKKATNGDKKATLKWALEIFRDSNNLL
ncbi:hypothetical protein [Chryseobacterium sp. SIMBA_029]|uniref:hypothetical protein n=1 Tax=Chryseobacterium sp. SIMBA_029 TaxID=3085772 RepID=UPI0039786F09